MVEGVSSMGVTRLVCCHTTSWFPCNMKPHFLRPSTKFFLLSPQLGLLPTFSSQMGMTVTQQNTPGNTIFTSIVIISTNLIYEYFRACDWSCCWSILLHPEPVTEVSDGRYYFNRNKWLRFVLEDTITSRASDWGFCWRIILQPEQVTEISGEGYNDSQSKWLRFLLEENITTRASDWGIC